MTSDASLLLAGVLALYAAGLSLFRGWKVRRDAEWLARRFGGSASSHLAAAAEANEAIRWGCALCALLVLLVG